MTRKDYCILADVLADSASRAKDKRELVAIDRVRRLLCLALAEDNPEFDEARFLARCMTYQVQ